MKKFIFIFFIICAGKLCAVNSIENDLEKNIRVTLRQAYDDNKISLSCKMELSKVLSLNKNERPSPLWALHKKKKNAGRKVLGAVLAFPLPFGVIGLHRIYLGTKPYVPLIYIGTIGGGFGILPFIDFWVILLDKDIDHYKDNSHVFMWIENQDKKPETTNSYD